MSYIVHVLSRTDWQTFKQQGEYRPDSLAEDGFIHCSKIGQITLVADYNYTDADDVVLLLLDDSQIDPPVRYETDGEDGESAFPHIYGTLTLEPVVETYPFKQDETGFWLPETLLNSTLSTT
ncbi:DUF952 domain-containing protein [Halorubrum sp. F4]|uniref:DUF952 domain-containing protein n=1 Tax=Halorubrum sp. F4 TaxID=2989715 RepID=UPI0024819177|nr:DUF952 domain-containing protein [Halorubrum sp. F4]